MESPQATVKLKQRTEGEKKAYFAGYRAALEYAAQKLEQAAKDLRSMKNGPIV